MTAKKKPQEPPAQPEPLTTTLWQRLLDRLRELDPTAMVLMRSCPVVTVETGGLCLVVSIECPRDFVFDELAKHMDAVRLAASDVLDVNHLQVWRRLAPDAKCTRLTDDEWVERSVARQQLAVNDGWAHHKTPTSTTPLDPRPSA